MFLYIELFNICYTFIQLYLNIYLSVLESINTNNISVYYLLIVI